MRRLLIAVITAMTAMNAAAQVIHITGTVYQRMKTMEGTTAKTPLEGAVIYVFDNAAKAQRQAREYRARAGGLAQGSYFEIKSNDVERSDYDGHFEADISADGALLVTYQGTVKYVKITKSLNYDIIIASTSDFILKNVDVVGKRKGIQMKELPPVDDGPNMHWKVNIVLPQGYSNADSRLIFQPIVIDCGTEDTLQYLEPIVLEGRHYHNNQIRRDSYDYERNDSLSPYYRDEPRLDGQEVAFTWETTYPKPDAKKTYKWISDMTVEDYTNVYYHNNEYQGTCNSRKPWKMLDLGFAVKRMPLDERFYERARAKLREIPRDLQLTFRMGYDILTDDETNRETINHLIAELKSYGRQLVNVKIQGTASPEGTIAANRRLADKRARKALAMIGPYVTDAGMQVAPAKVYTWYDVADSLERRGYRLEASQLREHAGKGLLGAITAMKEQIPVMEEIMKNQRLMKCSYTLRQNKVLDPDEALWTYRHNPGFNEFSNGDYYNLLRMISDPKERKELISKAWRLNRVRKTSRYSAFAAWLANSKACDAIENDSADTGILEPFIDMRAALEVTRPVSFDGSYLYTVNRREMVANQAIIFFKKNRLGEARHLADKLPDSDDFRDIKMFTDLETLFFKQNKSEDERQRATAALNYVMGTSKMNRAVLLFELAPELGKTLSDVEPTVDSLPEESARKWYMKTVIEAERTGENPGDANFMDLVNKYGGEEALKMTENATPRFLAYLQHTLDIDPTFYGKYYVSDCNVSDAIRKKYPYDKTKADEYRRLFNSLTEAKKEENP